MGRIDRPYKEDACVYMGQVVARDDDLKLGRVRVSVPGVYDESPWAIPIGMALGVNNGIWGVPEIGTNVVVWAHQGHLDFPIYCPANFAAPGGSNEKPPEAVGSGLDFMVMRWRGLSITFDGQPGQEKLIVEDKSTESKIEFDRQTKDVTINSEGSLSTEVEEDNDLLVEKGDHGVVVAEGDMTEVVTAGDRTETVTAGNSSEVIVAGNKSVLAGGTITMTATGAMILTAAAITLTSLGAGFQNFVGLMTRSYAGGITDTIVGAVVRNITGAFSIVASGIIHLSSSVVRLGSGTQKKLATEDFVLDVFNAHTHPDPVSGDTGPPDITGSSSHLTSNTTAS